MRDLGYLYHQHQELPCLRSFLLSAHFTDFLPLYLGVYLFTNVICPSGLPQVPLNYAHTVFCNAFTLVFCYAHVIPNLILHQFLSTTSPLPSPTPSRNDHRSYLSCVVWFHLASAMSLPYPLLLLLYFMDISSPAPCIRCCHTYHQAP